MSPRPARVGLIGCGNICGIYMQNAQWLEPIEIVACADLVPARAAEQAAKYKIPRALPVDDLINDPDIDIVLNLTIPRAHAELNLAALRAGKSIYCEKPLALNRAEGEEILRTARDYGLSVGCAPDTFLGGGLQTVRKLIDDDAIGKPVAATAFMISHGTEGWHPDPDFFYQEGAGPLFDMGPYYLTALIHLLGPVRRVCCSARASFPTRLITSQPKNGTEIQVRVPTHVAGVIDFASGPVATLITTFDVWHAQLPRIEVYGATGSLSVPDPNTFGGPVQIRRATDKTWSDAPMEHPYVENSRGVGLADLANAINDDRPARASGELALHVLDVMQSLLESSATGKHIDVKTTVTQPAPLSRDTRRETVSV